MGNNDTEKYTKENLDKIAVYELRVLGRRLGISNPTAMRKEALIEAICNNIENYNVDVKETEDTNSITRKKQGRPPKKSTTIILHDSGPEFEELEKEKEAEEPKTEEPERSAKILSDITSGAGTAFDEKERKTMKKGEDNKNNSIQNNKADNRGKTQNKNAIVKKNSDAEEATVPKSLQQEEEDQSTENSEEVLEIKEGVLEIMPDGYGFLRAHNYEGGEKDAYVSAQKIKKSGLRKGDWIKAEAKKNCENRPAGVVNILTINGKPYDQMAKRKNFDSLLPIYPDSRFRLEIDGAYNDFAIRSIDLVAPIGKGQRAMIVSPPKAGKTTLLKKIANSISVNYPQAHLIVLLIDERPEEVTDMQRSIKGEVVYSTFDELPEHHTKAAELVLERAKRLVEMDEDVVILMDSLTRLARAYNLTIAPTGRTLSGGIDPGALYSPKRFFGAARNIENGGSLTIIATALIDTGSRMDDVIYEEFKGTGNMEIHLDRKLSEKRIFPAIDLNRSGTRREELLLTQRELETVYGMRRMLNAGDGGDASEIMISELVKTKTNAEFMEQMDMKIKMMQKQGFWKF